MKLKPLTNTPLFQASFLLPSSQSVPEGFSQPFLDSFDKFQATYKGEAYVAYFRTSGDTDKKERLKALKTAGGFSGSLYAEMSPGEDNCPNRDRFITRLLESHFPGISIGEKIR